MPLSDGPKCRERLRAVNKLASERIRWLTALAEVEDVDEKPGAYGFPEEWHYFCARLPNLQSRLAVFFASAQKVVCGSRVVAGPADRVVYFLGNACIEDFNEILQLGFNGYGVGALKLLRGLYERTVTEAFLANKPEATERFLDFGDVQMWRAVESLRHDFPENLPLSERQVAEAKAAFDRVKGQFENKCEKCGNPYPAASWKSHYTVAKKGRPPHVDKDKPWIDHFAFAYYFRPTLELHATRQSIFSRLEVTQEGLLRFKSEAQRKEAEEAMRAAHHLALASLEIQNRYFRLNAGDEVDARHADFLEAWKVPGGSEVR
jgi:hypothetical protein